MEEMVRQETGEAAGLGLAIEIENLVVNYGRKSGGWTEPFRAARVGLWFPRTKRRRKDDDYKNFARV